MRTAHCLELGHINEHWKRYEEAYGWFMEAWRRLSPLDRTKGMKNKDVLQYLIWSEYKVRGLERQSLFFLYRIEMCKLDADSELFHELRFFQGAVPLVFLRVFFS